MGLTSKRGGNSVARSCNAAQKAQNDSDPRKKQGDGCPFFSDEEERMVWVVAREVVAMSAVDLGRNSVVRMRGSSIKENAFPKFLNFERHMGENRALVVYVGFK